MQSAFRRQVHCHRCLWWMREQHSFFFEKMAIPYHSVISLFVRVLIHWQLGCSNFRMAAQMQPLIVRCSNNGFKSVRVPYRTQRKLKRRKWHDTIATWCTPNVYLPTPGRQTRIAITRLTVHCVLRSFFQSQKLVGSRLAMVQTLCGTVLICLFVCCWFPS